MARAPLKLLLATDAWHPQVNGVVTTIDHLLGHLADRGSETRVISPADFPRQFGCGLSGIAGSSRASADHI